LAKWLAADGYGQCDVEVRFPDGYYYSVRYLIALYILNTQPNAGVLSLSGRWGKIGILPDSLPGPCAKLPHGP
jgi:hypothetical protein